ncbi:hypothetical protein DY000_02017487 [Brassica cretica]|uniref:Uncharacterized protein n=1 Tax=Brassica cretica TaxID=69181 RepID=A0ABQ7D8V2_BRACR|nr:hypothetical protein DY000_02017487 [Brassica cretica]
MILIHVLGGKSTYKKIVIVFSKSIHRSPSTPAESKRRFIPTENDAQVCLHTRKLLRSTRACKYFQELRFNLLKDAVKEGLLHFQKGSVSTRNLNDHQHRP